MSAVLTFSDEFNSLNLWNGSAGTWATNFWYADPNGNGSSLASNGEQQWYINANYAPTASVKPWTVDNGVLTLTAAPADAATQALIGGYQYTSGEINSYHSFSQTYGYFEMRAELPAGQGLWPAFWLLPANGAWPPELDIFEVLGNDPGKLYTTVHTNQTGVHTSSGVGTVVSDMSVGYHTYGVDWEADKITWYYDGGAVYQVATPADMNQPMYLIANLAVGGYWPGNADATTAFPAQMAIDYIRAYSSMPAEAAVPVAAAPADPTQAVSLTARDDVVAALTGAAGDDTLTAGHQADTLTGGAGADSFVFKAVPWNAGHITDFTPGIDRLDLSALFKASGYVSADPEADGYLSFASDGAGGTTVLYDVDGKAAGSPWPFQIVTLDHVSPDGLTADQLLGASSPTTVSSTPAASSVATPSGSDVLQALAGGVEIHAGAGDDTVTGLSGANYLRGDDGNDLITGGSGFDDINGNAGDDTAHGGPGDDWVVGGGDNDTLFGDDGADIVYGNLGADTLDGGAGNDLIRGGQGNDVVVGGAGDDWLSGDRGADTLTGGAGADIFHSFSGAGLDRVTDFSAAEGDRVQLDPGTTYAVSQVGADTVIDMGAGDQMVLVGVQAATLPAGWIFSA